MDKDRFDRWTLAHSERLSRRGLGRLGAGALVALGIALATNGDADAKKTRSQ